MVASISADVKYSTHKNSLWIVAHSSSYSSIVASVNSYLAHLVASNVSTASYMNVKKNLTLAP